MQAEIYEASYWIKETDPEKLKQQLEKLLHQAKFTQLGFIENHFEPQGYTALWLLAESHLAVHSFPEENKTYVQVSCCNQEKHFMLTQSLVKFGGIDHGNTRINTDFVD